MQPAQDQILEQLRTAFPGEPIEPDGAFAEWGATYPDAEPYLAQLAGKRWDQLDREHLVRRSDALGFLGTRHLAAVLPVYLRALVEEGVWSPAAGMLTQILTRPAPGQDSGLGAVRFDALLAALTEPQRAAVATVLRAFGEQDADGSLGQAAQAALEGPWKAYLPADS